MDNEYIYTSKKHNIIYQLRNKINGKIYIGQHRTDNIDDNYLGSGGKHLQNAKLKYGIDNFEKTILFDFSTFEEMNNKEIEIVNEEFIANDQTYNKVLGGITGFNTTGYTTVKDNDDNTFMIRTDDPRYLSGELVGFNKGRKYPNSASIGFVSVKDKNGNCFRVPSDDPKYLNGELVGVTKNTITVKDKDGNAIRVQSDDPRYLSGELVGVLKGKTINLGTVTVRDKNGNVFKVSTNDPRYLSGELVHSSLGFKHDKVICPHCGKKGGGGNMKRYHFNNCKSKLN